MYRKTEMQPVEKRQKAEAVKKLTDGRTDIVILETNALFKNYPNKKC